MAKCLFSIHFQPHPFRFPLIISLHNAPAFSDYAIGFIRMLTNTLILLLIALSGIDATCKCYAPQSSIVKGTNVKISNAYDDDTYIACYMNTCGFIADSGTASVGWTNATVQFSIGSDPSGILTFYDGTNDGPNNVVIASVSASDSLNGATTVPLYSSTSSIYVKYSQDDPKKPNQYYGTLIANSGLALPTTTVAPTTVPTTRYFQDSLYPRDPWQISHDLLILINPKTDLGDTGLNALNNLTTQLVTLLNNTSGSSKTRLGFATLTPYFPNYAAQGEIWKMTSNDVLSALPKAGVTSNVSVVNALKQVVPTFFNVATDNNPAPTRLNAQRSVIVFTAGLGGISADNHYDIRVQDVRKY
uniref:VWFA domain-containing protein n=2 Tax=Caenorhabditis japonica TaxID=281687 RepID=A0A8R1E5G9_CAEJA